MKKKETKEIYLVLYDIRSSFNVGSMFRVADCLGVKKIFLVGITPAPKDRFGSENKEIKKVALGGEKNIPWKKVRSISKLFKKLRDSDIKIISLEQSSKAVDYKEFHAKFPFALIVGNEVRGLPKKVLDESDSIIEIKMLGKKESLNVGVATAVALFRIADI